MKQDEVILVDEHDREIGKALKLASHLGEGMLHRAFSVFLFNPRGELLLQQRSANKLLWPEYWSNSCCSHPRPGEFVTQAATRRVTEELGVVCTPSFFYKFRYHANFGETGVEREVCHVLGAVISAAAIPDPEEVADIRYITPESLDVEISANPERFTPWFRMEWPRVRELSRQSVMHGTVS